MITVLLVSMRTIIIYLHMILYTFIIIIKDKLYFWGKMG